MRNGRRGGHAGLELGGSGEDSFVAVVVTKLTGALLFILLLTMVIMALLPKAVDLPAGSAADSASAKEPETPLAVVTPATLPEAIAGRPYQLALAAEGGKGSRAWSVDGPLPEGLACDPKTGRIEGTPARGTPRPVELLVRVSDGSGQASGTTKLLVYQSDQPLTTPAWWKPGVPPVPWNAWLQQGFGFLVLFAAHATGMSALAGLQRWSSTRAAGADHGGPTSRFAVYRASVRLTTLSAAAVLAVWLVKHAG